MGDGGGDLGLSVSAGSQETRPRAAWGRPSVASSHWGEAEPPGVAAVSRRRWESNTEVSEGHPEKGVRLCGLGECEARESCGLVRGGLCGRRGGLGIKSGTVGCVCRGPCEPVGSGWGYVSEDTAGRQLGCPRGGEPV